MWLIYQSAFIVVDSFSLTASFCFAYFSNGMNDSTYTTQCFFV